jgi:hypothetical protein
MDVRDIGIEDAATSLLGSTLWEAIGMNELAYRSAVYGKGSSYGTLRDALVVQLNNFEVASIALLASRPFLALISGRNQRLRTLGQRITDQLRLGDVFFAAWRARW